MLTKQDVRNCMSGKFTPIVPAYLFWLDYKFIEKHRDEYLKLKEQFEDDFIFTYPVLDKRAIDDILEPGEFSDDWGSLFCAAPDGVGAHPTRPIVRTFSDWERYVENFMPFIDSGKYAAATREASMGNPDKYVVTAIWRTFYERMYMLMNIEELWMAIALEEKIFTCMLPVLKDFTIKCIRQAGEAGASAVFLADDWGTQDRLQISPQLWKKYFKPAYAEMIEVAHSYDMDVWMHSCGNITELIPEWIDIGLDVIGQLQTAALDLKSIAEKYRGQITFFGGIDVQFNLINGNRQTIRDEVAALMKNFEAHKGKYMACPSNTIMPETPVENVRALYEAIREFGTYK